MTPNTVISLASLALSVSLAFFYIRDRRHARFAIEADYINSLTAWHAQVVSVLSHASHQPWDKNSIEHRKDLATLSALIDQGRFFFPNIENNHGSSKPPAYRGYRNLALDFLVASYNLLNEEFSENAKAVLRSLQQHFTSVVFEIVNPKMRLQTIKSLTDRYFIQEKSFEDFMSTRDGEILNHIWKSED